jgi:energy-coupling factor transporter ATP-binding protein EcfA2
MEKWYNRFYQQKFAGLLKAGKVLLVYGPRRAGKTSAVGACKGANVRKIRGQIRKDGGPTGTNGASNSLKPKSCHFCAYSSKASPGGAI